MRKLSTKRVPKCLNADQKRQRCQSSEQLLAFFRRDPNDFLSRLVTMDKTGYITMTRRQSNNQWSGGTADHPAPKIPSAKIPWKISRLIFWDQDGILLIFIFQKAKLSMRSITYLSWCNWRTFWKKNAAGKSPRGLVLARQCPGSPGTCNPEETGHPGLPVSWSPTLFFGSGPVGLLPVLWTEKTIERSPYLSDAKIIAAAENWLNRQHSDFFLGGLQKFEEL